MRTRILATISVLFAFVGCATLVEPVPTEDAAPTSVDAGLDAAPARCIPAEPRPTPLSVPACSVDAFDAATYTTSGTEVGNASATVAVVLPDRIELELAEGGGTAVMPWVGPDLTAAFAVGETVTVTVTPLSEQIDGPRATAVRARWGQAGGAHWGTDSRTTTAGTLPGFGIGEATCTHGVGSSARWCDCGSGGWEQTMNAILVGAARAPIDPGATVEVEGWMVTNVSTTNIRFLETCRAGIAPGDNYATFLATTP